jgi:hypothetical protein
MHSIATGKIVISLNHNPPRRVIKDDLSYLTLGDQEEVAIWPSLKTASSKEL